MAVATKLSVVPELALLLSGAHGFSGDFLVEVVRQLGPVHRGGMFLACHAMQDAVRYQVMIEANDHRTTMIGDYFPQKARTSVAINPQWTMRNVLDAALRVSSPCECGSRACRTSPLLYMRPKLQSARNECSGCSHFACKKCWKEQLSIGGAFGDDKTSGFEAICPCCGEEKFGWSPGAFEGSNEEFLDDLFTTDFVQEGNALLQDIQAMMAA